MSDPVIIADRLSKRYRLGVIGRQTLKDELTYLWHKALGRNPLEHMGKVEVGQQTDSTRLSRNKNTVFWALKDISFKINRGEVVGIIGRNGSGKSTLLKLLSRITEPTTGEAFIEGRVGSMLEVGTGFHPELTGRENVYMNGAILGMKKREIDAKFDEIVAFSELEKFIDTPVKRYSSGMYVRLAFAVAAHLEPEILLVDEVLAVGDSSFQKKCLGKMGDVAKQGRTVLFVSHQMGAVAQLCRRVLLLDEGRLVAQGDTESMIDAYLGSRTKQSEIYCRASCDASQIQIRRAATIDESRKAIPEFDWKKRIGICMELSLPELPEDLVLSVSLKDRLERRIFTVEKTCRELGLSSGIRHVEIHLPEKLLLPGVYSFMLALHVPNRKMYDLAEKACAFHVVDTGSECSKYSSKEYGVFVVECQWVPAADFPRQEQVDGNGRAAR